MTGIGPTGEDLIFIAYDADFKVWNGSVFEVWNNTNFLNYIIVANELGDSGRFTADDPTGASYYELRFNGNTLEDSYVLFEGFVLPPTASEINTEINANNSKLNSIFSKLPSSGIISNFNQSVNKVLVEDALYTAIDNIASSIEADFTSTDRTNLNLILNRIPGELLQATNYIEPPALNDIRSEINDALNDFDVAKVSDINSIVQDLNGTGAFEVKIRIIASSSGLGGINVTIRSEGGGTTLTPKTDIDGYVTVNLNAGTYKVLVLSGPNYTPLAAQTLSVTGDTSVSYTLSPTALPSISTPGRVLVYGDFGLPRIKVAFDVNGMAPILSGDTFIPDKVLYAETNAAGRFSIELYPSYSLETLTGDSPIGYKVTCRELNIVERLIMVPDTSVNNIATLFQT